MLFEINFKSAKPVYLQLTDQVKSAAASGALRPGEPLPTIRPLAEHLRVNRNTVAKAYAELENQGVIETLPGKGCFLKSGPTPLKKEARQQLLNGELDALIVQAHHLQIEPAELLTLLQRRLEAFATKLRNHTAAQQP